MASASLAAPRAEHDARPSAWDGRPSAWEHAQACREQAHLLPAAGKATPQLVPWGPHGALTLYRDESTGQQRTTTLTMEALLLPPAAGLAERQVRSLFASLRVMNLSFAGAELSSCALLRESVLRPLPRGRNGPLELKAGA